MQFVRTTCGASTDWSSSTATSLHGMTRNVSWAASVPEVPGSRSALVACLSHSSSPVTPSPVVANTKVGCAWGGHDLLRFVMDIRKSPEGVELARPIPTATVRLAATRAALEKNVLFPALFASRHRPLPSQARVFAGVASRHWILPVTTPALERQRVRRLLVEDTRHTRERRRSHQDCMGRPPLSTLCFPRCRG